MASKLRQTYIGEQEREGVCRWRALLPGAPAQSRANSHWNQEGQTVSKKKDRTADEPKAKPVNKPDDQPTGKKKNAKKGKKKPKR